MPVHRRFDGRGNLSEKRPPSIALEGRIDAGCHHLKGHRHFGPVAGQSFRLSRLGEMPPTPISRYSKKANGYATYQGIASAPGASALTEAVEVAAFGIGCSPITAVEVGIRLVLGAVYTCGCGAGRSPISLNRGIRCGCGC